MLVLNKVSKMERYNIDYSNKNIPIRTKKEFKIQLTTKHCVKGLRIRSFSGPYFPLFGLDMERYPYLSVFSPNAGKYGPGKSRIRRLFTQLKWKTLQNV